LRAADNSLFVVNERGTRAEMDALAERVGKLLNRPVREPQEKAPAPQTTTYTPASVMTSLYENLVLFTESVNPANEAPPIAAGASVHARQEEMERARRELRPRRETREPAPPNTLSARTPASSLNAPQLELSGPEFSLPTNVESYDALNLPSTNFVAPPVLVMPSLPGLMSFGPALDFVSFPALSATMPSQTTTIYDAAEMKEVPAQVSTDEFAAQTEPSENESRAQHREARRLYGMRNFRDATAAYLRALSSNPADAAIHNDLGIVYFEQHNWHEAERAFRRAVALDPFSNASRYNLGVALQRMGQRNDAEEQFRVGAQSGTREEVERFRDALRGNLRAPLLSPAP
jgi:tetratricopeptide (TPR) repeat protein